MCLTRACSLAVRQPDAGNLPSRTSKRMGFTAEQAATACALASGCSPEGRRLVRSWDAYGGPTPPPHPERSVRDVRVAQGLGVRLEGQTPSPGPAPKQIPPLPPHGTRGFQRHCDDRVKWEHVTLRPGFW